MRALVCLIIVAITTAAQADPLTFYYDPSSFAAATTGLTLPPPFPTSTETLTYKIGVVNLNNFSNPIQTVETFTITQPFRPGFDKINGDFNVTSGNCNPGPLGCTFTALSSIVIRFSAHIAAFEGTIGLEQEIANEFTLNGQCISPNPNPPQNPNCGVGEYQGFFGAIGQTDTLEFDCPICGYGDFIGGFGLSLVPEPSSFVTYFGMVLLLLVAVRSNASPVCGWYFNARRYRPRHTSGPRVAGSLAVMGPGVEGTSRL